MGLKHYLMSASVLAGLCLATPTFAQETPGAEVDEIIVTATRRALNLQDVPINISAVGAEVLENQRLDDIKDVASFTPGITMVDSGPRATGTLVVRGLTANGGTGNNTSGGAVATYLGEVPLYLDFKLLDIQRVEVLLGPQGTLYGLGTMAGAARYLPNRPNANTFSGEAHGRAYNLAESDSPGWQGDFTVNIPIVQDHIALRSVIGYYDDPGFIDYPFVLRNPGVSDPEPNFANPGDVSANLKRVKDVNDEETLAIRESLLFKLNDDFEAIFSYVTQTTETHGRQANGAGVLGSGRYEGPWRYEEPSKRQATLYSMELNANLFDFADLVSATAFSNQKIRTQGDQTDLLLDLDYGYQLFPNFNAYTRGGSDYKQFNQEVRLVSSHGGPLSWVIGGFYNRFKTENFSFEIVPGLPGFYGLNRPDNIEYASFTVSNTSEQAFFGEVSYQITDAWQVTAGARKFEYEAAITGGTATPLRTRFPLINYRVRSGDTADDGSVFKFNTSYKFSDDLMVYGTVSNGYRIGGVNRVAPCPQPLPAGQNVCALPNELFFGPDKTLNKELGVRARVLDGRLQLTGAIYHIAWDDVQVGSRTVNGAVGITGNAAKAESKGLEFSFNGRINENWSVNGQYSYADAKLTSNAPKVVDGIYDVFAGDRLPGSQKHAGAAAVNYERPLSNGMEFNANYALVYTGDILSKIGQRGFGETVPDYWTSKAAVGVSKDNWQASLFADNLFNEYAVISIAQDTNTIGTVDGVTKRYYGYGVLRPRVIGLDLRYKY